MSSPQTGSISGGLWLGVFRAPIPMVSLRKVYTGVKTLASDEEDEVWILLVRGGGPSTPSGRRPLGTM